MRVRDAVGRDAQTCAAIYAPYVTDTAITFEYDPPSAAEMGRRIAAAQRAHAWLVLDDDVVAGYAYAGPYKERAAYRWTSEVSVYLEPGGRRRGGGRLLYAALFERLAGRGFRAVVAGLTLPNEASEGFHRAMGFEPIGVFRWVGWKHGQWRDVAWVQKTIADGVDPPAEPR